MIFASDSSVLVVFCKRPQLGIGKQRVAAERGAETAFELSRLLLSAAFEDAHAWDGPVVIAPASADDEAWARKLLSSATVVPQQGANLGERLNHVDRQLRAAGARKIIYIGTDAPGLNQERLQAAATQLDTLDTVLAPAVDGGVVLMGSRQPWPELGDLPWETAELCAALMQRCGGYAAVGLLEPGYDIDYWHDLQRALPELRRDKRYWRQTLADWAARQQRISVIVPVYRDRDALHSVLEKLRDTLSDSDEIIVVDGDAAADCESICAAFNARYLRSPTCRGLQLDTGATSATGDILWFLHADSAPPEGSAEAIRAAFADGAVGGYFRFSFLGPRAWYKSLLERAINWRSRNGVPYGDQGLFVSRSAYAAVGGFAHEPLFEEVALVKALRAAGDFVQLPLLIGVSPRRWERDGWLRRTLHNRMLAVGHRLGIHPARLARRY